MSTVLQVGLLEGEKAVLEEAATTAQQRLREGREVMAAQNRELGQLQHLPPRLQDMQDQVMCRRSDCRSQYKCMP